MLSGKFAVVNGSLRERSGNSGGSSVRRISTSKSKASAAYTATASGVDNYSPSVVESTMPYNYGVFPTTGVGINTYFTGLLPNSAIDDGPLIRYYRDMYSFDSVGGAAVDLLTSFPFSDYTLGGQDSKTLDIYAESVSRLNLRQLFPEIALNYLVDGAFIGSLIYDGKIGAFQDVMIHDRQNSTIYRSPFHTQDPPIRVNSAAILNQFMEQSSPYVNSVLQSFPKGLLETFSQDQALLDPLSTIYVPRKTTYEQPTASYLRRLLPMYMLEKFVYRGTLIESSKRLRATSHVQVGDETWIPTPEEMDEVRDLFAASELDPLGAWVVTRQGVNISDVRQGGEMWKWTDLDLTAHKLRALGISEAFLSADANYSNSTTAQSVFMESCLAFRTMLTQRVLEKKLFPIIALQNKLYRDAGKAVKNSDANAVLTNLTNTRNLKLPVLAWHKSLENPDASTMEVLEKLTEKGIPVTLRRWAAAGNLNLTTLLAEAEEDAAVREAVKQLNPDAIDEDGQNSEESRVIAKQLGLNSIPASSILSRRKRSILNRDMGNASEAFTFDESGKKKHVFNQTQYDKKQNEMIWKAQKELSDPNVRAQYLSRARERLGIDKVVL